MSIKRMENSTLSLVRYSMKTIFEKRYCGESIVDLERNLSELFDPDYSPELFEMIPDNKDGFLSGTFIVTVIWESN